MRYMLDTCAFIDTVTEDWWLMIDERECPQINRELKEIGPQADEDVMND